MDVQIGQSEGSGRIRSRRRVGQFAELDRITIILHRLQLRLGVRSNQDINARVGHGDVGGPDSNDAGLILRQV
jgi:hypothetical protein